MARKPRGVKYSSQRHRYVYFDWTQQGHISWKDAKETFCGIIIAEKKRVGIPVSKTMKFREDQALCPYCKDALKKVLKEKYPHLKEW